MPVLFIESTLKHQLLKVDKGHGDGDRLQATVLPDYSHLSLQTETHRERVTKTVSNLTLFI